MFLCLIATVLSAEETRRAKPQPVDARGKRNLEYTITHSHPTPQSYRAERRITHGPPQQRYSSFFPGPRPSTRKGRPQSLPPPYAVQMEPLIHYSQQDPLYDTNNLSLITDNNNDLSKAEDLQTDNTNNHISESVYGPPTKYIERPVYIKEPEPIIEIIIKESNISLPPVHVPVTAPPKKKKEEVQVFYVKYKKNPNGYGKDSIIYEKPIPAISPPVDDEHEEEEAPQPQYGVPEVVTSAPPPSTTLRTIIKPDSETYHSASGIKVTFGKEGFDYDKRSPKKIDDVKEASAPEPTISHPQARQFPISQDIPQRRQPIISAGLQSSPPFRPEPIRFSQLQTYRTLPASLTRPFQYKPVQAALNKPFSQPQPKFQQQFKLTPQFQNAPRPSFSPQFSQPLPNLQQEFYFNPPRQPVPYQPLPQLRPQVQPSPAPLPPPHFDFPTQTHFPVHQQLPLVQQQNVFQQQLGQKQQQVSLQHQQINFQQPQVNLQQRYPQQHFENIQQVQYQFQQKPTQQSLPLQNSQQQYQQQHQQPAQKVVPELIPSLSKYEQHVSVSIDPSQQPNILSQAAQRPLSQQEYRQQIQQQFSQAPHRVEYQIQSSSPLPPASVPRQKPSESFVNRPSQQIIYQSTPRPQIYVSSTTTTTTTERPTTAKAEPPKKDVKELAAQLPDEVPDDLRQQLLSSGILSNADISVLDYDKVGDIPLSALPPDQLANFYQAGGAQQIAGSEPVPSYVEKNGKSIGSRKDEDQEVEASESEEVVRNPQVEMKVVRYDPETEQGKKVQNSYVKDTATQVEPVVLNDQTYNKYLPLKVNGAEFPIPDAPELKGKNITSVVVLAPVSYKVKEKDRQTRDTEVLAEDIEFATAHLKDLLDNPTRENYEKFLESEKNASSDKQAVILLVAG